MDLRPSPMGVVQANVDLDLVYTNVHWQLENLSLPLCILVGVLVWVCLRRRHVGASERRFRKVAFTSPTD